MRHREIERLLADFGLGTLEPEAEAEIARHLADCVNCKDSLAAHRLLAAQVPRLKSRNSDHPDDHPESQVLAVFVVRPEEMQEPDQGWLRDHVEHCWQCRGALTRIRTAVLGARSGGSKTPASATRNPRASSRFRMSLAAGLAGAMLGGGLLLAAVFLYSLRAELESAFDAGGPSLSSTSAAPQREVAGDELDGNHLIEADRVLTVSKLTLRRGSNVTFRAGELVAFGDGFVVDRGARMRAGSGKVDRHEQVRQVTVTE